MWNRLLAIVFFREPAIYEVLRAKGLATNQRLYTPKSEKDMKFVAHDATIIHDFLANFGLYVATLEDLAESENCTDDVRSKAQGFLRSITDDLLKIDIKFLTGVVRILKRFSVVFQVIIIIFDSTIIYVVVPKHHFISNYLTTVT